MTEGVIWQRPCHIPCNLNIKRSKRGNKATPNLSRPNAGKHYGHHEINPLLVKLSVPMMISMLVQALYNVVDSVFVSHVSENAPHRCVPRLLAAECDDRCGRGHRP